ncbi:MAG: SDR family NAD(P)-dependent oxidoreductase [Chloroflexota bacterium]
MTTKHQPLYRETKKPVAIIGMACRFPGGVNSPDDFFDLIVNKTDAIVEVPADRWNHKRFFHSDEKKPGKTYAKFGGFLQEDIYAFDPLFFGISPREAEVLDPQQRYLLQVSYEALEDAGLRLEDLRESNTGVFVGGFTLDNKLTQLNQLSREVTDSYTAASASMAVLANRVSYIFGFQGPSIAVDTACSSSLVATHLACQSILSGESEMAIAGGVNIMTRPDYHIVMSVGKFLSKQGRCMAFDERADGYVRSEGCGLVVLKLLEKAEADGDNIIAIIRNTGINHDGLTKGIAMPNGASQQKLIERVYAEVGLSLKDSQYIEAHGTGTQAGDTTETGAIQAVLAAEPGTEKSIVGSVKTNIGHLEAAAGVAGLMKTALMVKQGKILPNIHFATPNPKIPFNDMQLRIPTETEDWPTGQNQRRASVNSFGYGGANAHAIIEHYEDQSSAHPTQSHDNGRYLILPITAQDDQALPKLAQAYRSFLSPTEDNTTFYDLIYSATTRRSSFKHRLAIIGKNKAEMVNRLTAYINDQPCEGIIETKQADGKEKPLVFVFTGMGPQWYKMGRELYETDHPFKAFVDKADTVFKQIAGWSVLAEMQKSETQSNIAETHIAQPANFILQAGIVASLAAQNIHPDVVVGHSVGEVASAYISGTLSLQDALTVSYHRSRLQKTMADRGGMLAVGLSENDVQAHLQPYPGVEIAAINSPTSVTLAGDLNQLKTLAAIFEPLNIFNRFLKVEVAYHCAQMDPIEEELRHTLSTISPCKNTRPLYSTVTAEAMDGTQWDNAYWWANVRKAVCFSDTIQQIAQDFGEAIYMEIGPHPVLRTAIIESLDDVGIAGHLVQTLNRKTSEVLTLKSAIARLFGLGIALDWPAVNRIQGKYTKLPSYPWSLQPYRRITDKMIEALYGNAGPVYFHEQIDTITPTWEVEFNDQFFPYAKDHQVENNVVFPGAAYIEVGLALGNQQNENQPLTLQDIKFHTMLVDQAAVQTKINIQFNPDNGKFSVQSRRVGQTNSWQHHASGIVVENSTPDLGSIHLNNAQAQALDLDAFYQTLAQRGLNYGPCFRSIKWLKKLSNHQILAELTLASVKDDYAAHYILHPTLLDGAFQSMMAFLDNLKDDGNRPYIPVGIETVLVRQKIPTSFQSLVEVKHTTENAMIADITLFDQDNQILALLRGVKCQQFGQIAPDETRLTDCFYDLNWIADAEHYQYRDTVNTTWLVVGGNAEDTALFSEALDKAECTLIQANDTSDPLDAMPLPEINALTDVLCLLALDHTDSMNGDAVLNVHTQFKNFVQTLLEAYSDNDIRLHIVTKNAHAVVDGDTPYNLIGASLTALSLVIENEHPNIACFTTDIDSTETLRRHLTRILFEANAAKERAFRKAGAYRQILSKSTQIIEVTQYMKQANTREATLAVRVGTAGDVNSLHFEEITPDTLGANDIQICVQATALNFKDLLKVYNQIDDSVTANTYYGDTIGMEVSGEVVAVGENVDTVSIGDKVVALVPDSFRTQVTVDAHYVMQKPSSLTHLEAPTLVGSLTAYYGLIKLAQLEEGEKVLIHNATGGVGSFALQIAKHKKAEIYATAGTSEKRAYLKSMGIHHIYDSRSLKFAEEIRKDTNGYGVDVVLNAIAGAAVTQSFNLLAPYGRFIEIGKKNIADNHDLPMKAFNENLLFAAVDIDRILKDKPKRVKQYLAELSAWFETGILGSIPTKVFAANEIIDAFKFMSQSKHLGKVVLNFDHQPVDVVDDTLKSTKISATGSYLVTGGTKGFGLEIAKWLASQAAGQLILVSRHGANTTYVQQEIQKLREQGANIQVLCVDVSDEQAVKTLIDKINRDPLPLKGIFHAAVVLEDSFIANLTDESLAKVLRPKLLSALYLHHHTKHLPLDIFFCFSSISALVGNPGQASYVIANAFLDALCHYRRTEHMAGMSVNWGAISEVGILSRKTDIAALFEKAGLGLVSPEEAVEMLRLFFENDIGQIGAFRIDWEKWAATNLALAQTETRFANFLGNKGSGEGTLSDIRTQFVSAVPEGKALQNYTLDMVLKSISEILKFPIDKLDPKASIKSMGVDSLVAVELSLMLKQNMGVEFTAVDLLAGPSPETLTGKIVSIVTSAVRRK